MEHDLPEAVAAGLPGYAELQCQSNFSFLQGASHPEELVTRAAELGYAALAITDECSLAGAVRAHVEAKARNLPLLIGATFQLRAAPDAAPLGLTLLAQTREGYGNLSELITLARTRAPKGEYRLAPEDLTHPPAGYAHLRHMPECLAILSPAYGLDAERMTQQARWLARAFGQRAWVGLSLLHRCRDDLHRAAVEQAAQAAQLPVVALGQVQMHVRSRKPLHDTLTGIRTRQPVSQCGYELSGNAEQHLRTRMRLANLYPPRRWPRRWWWPAAARFRWSSCATNIRTRSCRAGTRRPPTCARKRRPGPCAAFPAGCRRKWPRRSRKN